MGRKATAHSNLPPHMRKRVRKYATYYYFDTGAKPRKEIALGTDYILALRKYAELNAAPAVGQATSFGDVMSKYLTDVLPTLARNTIKTNSSDIKHLQKYFSKAPIEQIRPTHILGFLGELKAIPTTANRCKRLFSSVWNHARGWGYTDLPNPCEGIKGLKVRKSSVYITDDVYDLVYRYGKDTLKDAMDLAYFTGQRPADTLKMTDRDIVDGHLLVTQNKVSKALRVAVTGELAALLGRVAERKKKSRIITAAILVNSHGKRLTGPALRYQFDKARAAAWTEHPERKAELKKFCFKDLRAKAADDTSDMRGDQAASDLLGHENVQTTKRHYLRRGKAVSPTK